MAQSNESARPPAAEAPFGPGKPVFVVGEAGSNWRAGELGGDEERAYALIDAAADASCDAVKFQVFRAATVYAPRAGRSDYLSEAGIRDDITKILASLDASLEVQAGVLCVHKNVPSACACHGSGCRPPGHSREKLYRKLKSTFAISNAPMASGFTQRQVRCGMKTKISTAALLFFVM